MPACLGIGRVEGELRECTVLRRVNRFSVEALVSGERELVHLNNTGRLLELLVPGNSGICVKIAGKKLRYRLVALRERGGYALVDTRIQERVLENMLRIGALERVGPCAVVKKYPRVGGRVYDFYAECARGKFLVEAKSATMRVGGFASYPDSPTDRGISHIVHLPEDSRRLGARPLLVFIAGLRGVEGFAPNHAAEPRILDSLVGAITEGLEVMAVSIYLADDMRTICLGSSDLKVSLIV